MLFQRFVEVDCICFLHCYSICVFSVSFFMASLLMWIAFPFTQRKKSSKRNVAEDDAEGDDSRFNKTVRLSLPTVCKADALLKEHTVVVFGMLDLVLSLN